MPGRMITINQVGLRDLQATRVSLQRSRSLRAREAFFFLFTLGLALRLQ